MSLRTKRAYAPPRRGDGVRILVDRLWPRGLAKKAAAIDAWMRECAPSDALRKCFRHDRAKWREFKRRYFAELKAKEALLAPIRTTARKQRVTLLFGAADIERNNAVALMEYLRSKKPIARRGGSAAPDIAAQRTSRKKRRGGRTSSR